MREATIGGLSALDTVGPRRPAVGRKPGPGGTRRRDWGPRLRRLRTRFALIVGSAGLSAIMIGIVLNATVMQKGHHPAPLFLSPPAPPRLAQSAPAAVPAPSLPLASPVIEAAEPSPTPTTLTHAAPPHASSPVPHGATAAPRLVTAASKPRGRKPVDGIAQLIAGGGPAHVHRRLGKPDTTVKSASVPTRPKVTKIRPAPILAASPPADPAVN